MKKKVFLLGLTSAAVIAVGVIVANVTVKDDSYNSLAAPFHAGPGGDYVLEFSPTNLPADIPTSYQNTYAGSVKTVYGNDINMTYVNVKLTQEGVKVANHGRIYNYGSGNTKISGINGVSFTGAGSFIFRPVLSDGSGKGYVVKENAVVIEANQSKVTVPECDYFELEAGDSGATLVGLNLSYSCDPDTADIRMLDGTYTGIGSDSSTYKLVVSNGAVSVASLDKQTNISLSGTATMVSKTRAQCAFTSPLEVTYVMDFDGHSFTQVSKSGAAAAYAADLSKLNRVYNIEDFESYAKTGDGYINATKKYETTGMRANYYADYYTTGSGEIGGNNWPVMTSTDNSNWRNNKGRNGSAGGIFKFSNGTSMRYIAMNELYGVKSVIGKGATLSFWARGAYTNTNFNTNHASNTTMKFYAYYDSPLTPSNQTLVRETFDFTVKAGSEWQHFEMPLTADKVYYGFGFYAQQSSGSHQFVPIDDIQIYTASPYAEYVPPVAVTGVALSDSELNLITGGAKQLTATVSPDNATNKNVTWSSNATSVATVDADGTVHAVAPGEATITVTTADGSKTATCAVTVANPSLTYPDGTYAASASFMGATVDVVIAFGNQTNGLIGVRVSNADMEPGSVEYNSTTKEFSIPTTGAVKFGDDTYTAGTITGKFDADNNRLINVNCDGQLSPAVSNLTLERPSSRFFDLDGTTSELQAQFKRRYRSTGGGWSNDPGWEDRVASNTTQYAAGSGAMSVRPYSGGDAYGFVMMNDFASKQAVKNIHFWVYNPGSEDVNFREWVYTSTGLSGAQEIGALKAPAGQWTYVAMGFNYSIYNFTISVWKSGSSLGNNSTAAMGTTLTFDNLYIF